MTRAYDLVAQKFNKLLVIEIDSSKDRGFGKQLYWVCQCDCGKTTSVDSWSLRNNKIKSCGCLRHTYNGGSLKHGMWQTRTYHTWEGMKQRCLNPEATRYPDYGAIGITVCERWLDFKNFLEDMGERPKGKTLDRIDPFGNYEPSNCRWATPYEQQHNQRRHHARKEEVPCL